MSHMIQDQFVCDINQDIVDFSNKNSWLKEVDEVSLTEFMEVNFINVSAPFILCSKLKPLMEVKNIPNQDNNSPRFIVNVSAMEG